VSTSDPASPADGEQWVRSDLAEWRISIGATTYKVSLTAV
jgi:hypothetical protein